MTHHVVPSETAQNEELMLVDPASGASSGAGDVAPPTGVRKHLSELPAAALIRLTANMRPVLPAAAGSVIVTPVMPLPAALHRTRKSVLALIV